MKVSIVTPTIRKEGLNILRRCVSCQTYKPIEWLVGSPFDPEISFATWVKDDFKGGYWTLNRIYNKLFAQATGDIIVTWQDFIWAPRDGIEKFVDALSEMGEKSVVSGVGDQYERINELGQPEVKIWSDPRKSLKHGSFYECYPNDAEWNWCAFPKKAVYDIGGMDEGLDFLGYGGDQLQAVERMDALGYKFYLDQTNESFTLRHGREDFGGQKDWDKKHVILNGEYDKRKWELSRQNKWPTLEYLKPA